MQSASLKDKDTQTWAQAKDAAYRAYQDSLYAYGCCYYCEVCVLQRSVVPANVEVVAAEAE